MICSESMFTVYIFFLCNAQGHILLWRPPTAALVVCAQGWGFLQEKSRLSMVLLKHIPLESELENSPLNWKMYNDLDLCLSPSLSLPLPSSPPPPSLSLCSLSLSPFLPYSFLHIPIRKYTQELGDKMRSLGHEYGVTTGRPRRCGWLDTVVVKYTAMINGFTRFICIYIQCIEVICMLYISESDCHSDASMWLQYYCLYRLRQLLP